MNRGLVVAASGRETRAASALASWSATKHSLHQDVFETAPAIENCVDLNYIDPDPVDDPPRSLLDFAPSVVSDRPEFRWGAATARKLDERLDSLDDAIDYGTSP
jgi:hypothetical protein